jgi:hypothetical protein
VIGQSLSLCGLSFLYKPRLSGIQKKNSVTSALGNIKEFFTEKFPF